MTKSQEMAARIPAMLDECQTFLDEGKVGDAQAKMDEVEQLKAAVSLQKKLEAEEKEDFMNSSQGRMQEARKHNAIAEFAAAIRSGFKDVMTEGTNADGGYTVPDDVTAQVRNFREAFFDMTKYVSVEPVTTKTGARTYQQKASITGFSLVAESGNIPALSEPKFQRITYSIKDYAGFIPVSRQLLNDTDANLVRIIMKWFGRNSAVTRNNLILNIVKAKTQVSIGSMNDIRTALNVTLGSVYKPTSKIFVNDDALNYIDSLVDGQGRPLLNPDPTAPAQLKLRVGANVIPIVNIPNAFLPTASGVAPIIIGDLEEAITLFDREHLSIDRSDVASVSTYNAFQQGGTLFRGIEREDVVQVDGGAFIYGGITLANASSYGSGYSSFLGGVEITSGSGSGGSDSGSGGTT